ncbi:emopamil binding protein [Penicillium argentinense]|uniref:Emopamil binding protein n=1 Tax=Penicillium argentinense TaxID=1131581 RepID=A0A9W9EYJ9_9EURO|nr:emopamil binding protein [Penicillium argentinense]KAJ5090279.1 emopamil binding protein [Penicillium argentinense]
MADTVSHNYYPPGVKLPHFVPNEDSVISLIARFGALWVAVSIGATFLIRRLDLKTSFADQVTFVWMCLTGWIHLFFEAHFVLNHVELAGDQSLFGQLWKEYSLSDSRYLTSDSFLVSMEAVTAFCWGPLAFFIAYCIAVKHPLRYALQLIISVGQVYGDVLYYATSLLNIEYCRPERYYFWFYYFFFNFIWMVVGCCCIWHAVIKIWEAFGKLEQLETSQKRK